MFRVLAREMCNISFRELIVSCSIFKKIDSYGIVSVLVFDEELKSRVAKTKMMQGIDAPMRCKLDHEDCDSFVTPFPFTSRLESRDEILV